ncbi:phospholipase D-like domain-containing protein [Cytobacillus solani]|uniref:PLD phosphodiesterase domain-containing protein n=1 Tax=Cytobacillus solani TaxID=1637975 RepID=A0A0Q3VGI3_9BACI|nr:phospholipase D-like domain-containing protein [Cytobacillus solani]KQL18402.1 hypothetical protein AN957_07345 [Cytobacillus solani]
MSKVKDLYNFLLKYNLYNHLEMISSSLVFLQSSSNGFSKEQWIELTGNMIREAKDLASPLFSILVDLAYLTTSDDDIYFAKTELITDGFKQLKSYIELSEQFTSKEKSKLLWNMDYEFKNQLPQTLRAEFNELTSYLKNIISIAQNQVIFCAPYFSIAGIKVLDSSIQAAIKNNPELKFTFLVDAEEQSINRNFIHNIHLYIPKNNYSLYLPTDKIDDNLIFHSKFLIVDAKVGYLGSANFSDRALRGQFELGVKLSESDCRSLELLVGKWIKLNYLTKF